MITYVNQGPNLGFHKVFFGMCWFMINENFQARSELSFRNFRQTKLLKTIRWIRNTVTMSCTLLFISMISANRSVKSYTFKFLGSFASVTHLKHPFMIDEIEFLLDRALFWISVPVKQLDNGKDLFQKNQLEVSWVIFVASIANIESFDSTFRYE